ncbi:hypothetical protein DENSPDRAFT_833568 [Dentipellis sp. KUC8613]|nr:hypothetical protein DENSPDRAFT_833568 [Dentipellis sp. KUC8613]
MACLATIVELCTCLPVAVRTTSSPSGSSVSLSSCFLRIPVFHGDDVVQPQTRAICRAYLAGNETQPDRAAPPSSPPVDKFESVENFCLDTTYWLPCHHLCHRR